MNNIQIPAVGSDVAVVTSHRNINYFTSKDLPFETFRYQGIVLRNAPWVPADSFTVETGNSRFPISIISINNVVDMKSSGKSVQYQEFPVAGSKGKMYNVSRSGDHFACDCTGFKYHNKCKHIKLVKEGFTNENEFIVSNN